MHTEICTGGIQPKPPTACTFTHSRKSIRVLEWAAAQPSSTNACNINYYCRTREPSRFLLLHPIRIQGEMMKHSSGGGGGGDVAAAHSVLGILITPASTRKWRHCYRDSSGDRNKYTEDDEEHGQKTFFIKFSYAPSLRSPTALELRHLITDSISRYLCIQMQSQMISIVCEECRTKDNPITRRMHCVFQLRSPARQISKVKTFI